MKQDIQDPQQDQNPSDTERPQEQNEAPNELSAIPPKSRKKSGKEEEGFKGRAVYKELIDIMIRILKGGK